jgi:hypothetical protein
MLDQLDGPRILDTTGAAPLSAAVKSLLQGASAVRVAVGYLFIEGLSTYIEQLSAVDRIELLVGNVVNRLTDEQLRESGVLAVAPSAPEGEEFIADYRDARNRAATETALNLRRTIDVLARTEENREILIALARWIAEGRLKVRLYTEHRLHAKVTLAAYPAASVYYPGRAIVGTSNFTMPHVATVASAPSNLDVLVEGEANFLQLMRWFDRHWTQAQDFHRELFEELGRAWALAQE